MSDQPTARMLLSHNFNLNNNELPALNRDEFAQIFIDGLQEQANITCKQINNPHWVVEIIFPAQRFEAREIGQMCGEILISKRKSDADSKLTSDTLILGGKKATPVANMSPTALQPGEWGVDVVETLEGDIFLASINWEILTAGKSSDSIFKIEFIKN